MSPVLKIQAQAFLTSSGSVFFAHPVVSFLEHNEVVEVGSKQIKFWGKVKKDQTTHTHDFETY